MDVEDRIDLAAARIAAAIGDAARARMLYALMDGHARTSTELATIADVSTSTASAHLHRLTADRLVTVLAQGRHRYHRLGGAPVARVLEGLNVLGGATVQPFVPATPDRLRGARTCYDHLAGELAVHLHDRLLALGWIRAGTEATYDVTAAGTRGFARLGIDVPALRSLRRRFAYGCVDWSERRPHIGGAVGAALLQLLVDKRWVSREFDSRALSITKRGRDQLRATFGIGIERLESEKREQSI